jgi:putative Ca2+/H+ antiporter (TMEM165/GDT1 family)
MHAEVPEVEVVSPPRERAAERFVLEFEHLASPSNGGIAMWATLLSVFATVFLAEIGDKTQLATMLYAADQRASPWVVFAGASLALVAAAAVAVLVGAQVERVVRPATLKIIAGVGFIAIGLWTLVSR